ncbi:hypothetical protein JDS92_26490 [Bacillus cereus group sp. N12]|uniref:hypothetical protein n=1 Tax=Bacillus cereus group sp. N12 TaxID=2794586 RepID=UPI0018F3F072|nr:hypothetical protein [Bacillus cereus group sp. N12]MBJ8078865.1 hypothetical protein [Bacillus cereus group sp. N12]
MSVHILEELFQWGSKHQDNQCLVDIVITTNDVSKNNLVSYAEGTIQFYPFKRFALDLEPARFSAIEIKQYFSDRRQGICPFNCEKIGSLDISITEQLFNYDIYITSNNEEFRLKEASFDVASGIVYGTANKTFITISFCNRRISSS